MIDQGWVITGPSPLLAPVGSGFLQHSRNMLSRSWKTYKIIFSHPKLDFSWSAMMVHKIRTCTREIYVVSEPEYSVHWIICVSLLPQNRKHLRATAGRIHVDPIFPKAREYPCAYVSCSLPIKYIWTYGISSWSDNWNICLNSEWNLTETENHIRFQVQVIRE